MKYRALPNSDIERPRAQRPANIYDAEQLREFAAAPDAPRLTADEIAPVEDLAKENFGVGAERKRFKGVAALSVHRPVTMQRNAVRCR